MKAILLVFLCFLCSCGTSKRSTETEKHVTTNINSLDSLFRRDTTARTELLLLNEMLNAHIIITELSKPDSTGRQYPTKTTEIDISREKGELTVKSEQLGSETAHVKKQDVAVIEDEKTRDDVKKDTRMVPTWMWWFLGIGGVIAALSYWRSGRKK